MIVVYIVLNDRRETVFAQRSAALAPPAYRARLDAMVSRAARARTVAGLWLLDQGLGLMGCAPEQLDGLGFGPYGRPQFADGPWFSISHSEQLVACALAATGPVGLDVEQRRDGVSSRLRRAIAPTGDFFDAWCAREATVKASGRVGLARIRAVRVDKTTARLDDRDWHLARLALAPGYAGCVAVEQPAAIDCRDCGERLSGVRGE